MDLSTLVFFLITLALGGLLGYGMFRAFGRKNSQSNQIVQSSTILLERIEKVFKVVMAEGYFTEIFDHRADKKYLYIFNDSKKALIVAKAKVLVGFDFAKMRYRVDDQTNKMVIEYFPEPEVLSIDTDYKFYDIVDGMLNRFSQEDYTSLLNDAKKMMNDKAMSSDLPRIANNQIQFMMFQLASSMGWKIDLELSAENQKKLEAYNKKYDELQAEDKPIVQRLSEES